MNYFAIYDQATGGNIAAGGILSFESDAATQRLTDVQLTARGLVRVSIADLPTNGQRWNTTTHTIETMAVPPPLIQPLVDRATATTVMKTLLETNPASWTAAQERQAMYAILLLAFRDFQNGKVY